jgi:hypothetical protein
MVPVGLMSGYQTQRRHTPENRYVFMYASFTGCERWVNLVSQFYILTVISVEFTDKSNLSSRKNARIVTHLEL